MDTFQALSEPTRRTILELLSRQGKLAASDIQVHFHTSAPAISQHLKVLREANLVRVEKRAQQRIYQINPDKINEIEQWVQAITKHWEEKFTALDKLLAQEKAKLRKDPSHAR